MRRGLFTTSDGYTRKPGQRRASTRARSYYAEENQIIEPTRENAGNRNTPVGQTIRNPAAPVADAVSSTLPFIQGLAEVAGATRQIGVDSSFQRNEDARFERLRPRIPTQTSSQGPSTFGVERGLPESARNVRSSPTGQNYTQNQKNRLVAPGGAWYKRSNDVIRHSPGYVNPIKAQGTVRPRTSISSAQVKSHGESIMSQLGITHTGQFRSVDDRHGPGRDPNSDHLWGGAWDFIGPEDRLRVLVDWAVANTGPDKMFGKVFWGDSHHRNHVHISYNANYNGPYVLPGAV